MNENQKVNRLFYIVSQFIASLGFALTKDEFYKVKATIYTGKIHAIKHLRHVTRIKEEAIFKLDLTPRHDSTPHSTLTQWAITNYIDLRTGEVKERVLGLKDAKDTIEFIELNQ